MKKAGIAAMAAAALLYTTSIASAQACVLGIFVAAAYVGQHEHRELTSKEAWSCGLSYLFDKPQQKAKAKKKRVARRARHHRSRH